MFNKLGCKTIQRDEILLEHLKVYWQKSTNKKNHIRL
jgi:hypothetical protein